MRRYTVVMFPEERGGYTACIPRLGFSTQGDTVEEAIEMAKDLVETVIESLEAHHEVVLNENGAIITAIEI